MGCPELKNYKLQTVEDLLKSLASIVQTELCCTTVGSDGAAIMGYKSQKVMLNRQ